MREAVPLAVAAAVAAAVEARHGFPVRQIFVEVQFSNLGDSVLHVVLLPYCGNIGVYGAPFQEGPGVMARLMYGGRPSPIFDLKKVGNAYAADTAKGQEFPQDWAGVTELYGFQFQYTDGVDPDQTGLLVKNAVACIMNLEESIIAEWLILMEDIMRWRVESYDGDNEALALPKIVIHNGTEINIQLSTDMKFSCAVSIEAGSEDLAHVTDVTPPVYPKRFVILNISSEDATHVDICFTGNCKPFASGLAANKVPVKNLKKNASDVYYEKFYNLLDYKLDKKEQQDYIMKELLQDTFQGCPVFMKISGDTFKGAALELLDALKALPNVCS